MYFIDENLRHTNQFPVSIAGSPRDFRSRLAKEKRNAPAREAS